MEPHEIKTINTNLRSLYGRDEVEDLPKYRMVFSSTQIEKRLGDFSDYYGGIFLRTVREVREVPKYPGDKDRWILERFTYNGSNPELMVKFSYEPVWIFRGRGNTFVLPTWPAVQFVMKCHLIGMGHKTPQETQKEWEEIEAAQKELEVEEALAILGDEMRSPLFESESAVSYSSLDGRPSKIALVKG